MIQHTLEMQLRLCEALGRLVRRANDREEGQDMIEYGLLAALISIVAIVIILNIGGPLQSLFTQVSTTLSSV